MTKNKTKYIKQVRILPQNVFSENQNPHSLSNNIDFITKPITKWCVSI